MPVLVIIEGAGTREEVLESINSTISGIATFGRIAAAKFHESRGYTARLTDFEPIWVGGNPTIEEAVIESANTVIAMRTELLRITDHFDALKKGLH